MRKPISAKKADHADKNDRDNQQPHIAVHDMRQLVRDHGFQFVVLQRFDDAAGQGDAVGLFVNARCKGVQRGTVNNLELRHRYPARDTKIFQHVVKLGLLGAGDRP